MIAYITYAYLRTRIAYDHDDSLKSLWGLADWDDVLFFLSYKDHLLKWEDGVVIKIDSWMALGGLAERLALHLDRLDGWAMFDGTACVENPKGGPLTSVLRSEKEGGTRPKFAQLFIKYDEELRDHERLIESIREKIREPCRPIFHFRDGVILLVKSDISGRIINQRCRSYFENFYAWVIIDATDEYLIDEGPIDNVWLPFRRVVSLT